MDKNTFPKKAEEKGAIDSGPQQGAYIGVQSDGPVIFNPYPNTKDSPSWFVLGRPGKGKKSYIKDLQTE